MESTLDNFNSKLDQVIIGGKSGFHFIRVDTLAEKLGSSEVALRFLIGLFAGFPFSFVYMLLSKSSSERKHLFFTITGLIINYFCFGSDFVYNLFSIFITYVSLTVLGGTIINVVFTFLFQTVYLLVGYAMNASSDGYDVKWTTPQCILCMRLIGLAWDVYDGQQNKENLSNHQLITSIEKVPSMMEIFGFCYCFCGFLAGPQFSFQRYKKFVDGTLIDEKAQILSSSRYIESLKRFSASCVMMFLFQMFDSEYRSEGLLKPSLLEQPFFTKVLCMGIIYYVQYSKYVIVWWLSESLCMLLGLSYDGLCEEGKPKWDGLRNFKLRQFLFGGFFQDLIDSFNINTNQWAGRYLFRRFRFLGNKELSHVLTLLYLAIWHGFYIGYFIMFTFEFLQVIAEKHYCNRFKKLFGSFDELSLLTRVPIQLLGALFKFLACGFYVQSFMLLRWRKIKVVYASVYYWPIIVIFIWFLILNPITKTLSKKRKLLNPDGEKKQK